MMKFDVMDHNRHPLVFAQHKSPLQLLTFPGATPFWSS
jgi:hypothetical protein